MCSYSSYLLLLCHTLHTAKPGRVGTLVSILEAACTTSSLVSSSGVIWDFQREVHQGERAKSTTTTTSSPTTIVIPDQLFCELQSELFEGHPSCRAELLPQDESICDTDIEEEVIDVLVEFLALGAAVLIATQLITLMYTTHVRVVSNHSFGTRNGKCVSHPSVCGVQNLWLTAGCL